MARAADRVLRVLSVCPICFDQTGTLTAGVAAAAAVLVIALLAIAGPFAHLLWRIAAHPDAAIAAEPAVPVPERPRGDR